MVKHNRTVLAGGSLAGLLIMIACTIPRPHCPLVSAKPEVGCVAPDFALTDTGGQLWRLRSLEGRPTVLVFACGCQDCRRVVSDLARAAATESNVMVISSAPPGTIDDLVALSGGRFHGLFDPLSRTQIAYSTERCPRVCAVDRLQTIRYISDPHGEPPDTIVQQALESLGPRQTGTVMPARPASGTVRARSAPLRGS